MSSVMDQTALNEKIFVEQIKLLFNSVIPMLITNLLVGCLLVVGLWDMVAHHELIIWLSVMFLMLLIRSIIYFKYRDNIRSDLIKNYALYLTISSTIAGLIWGVGCYIFFPKDNLEYQIFILAVLYGMSTGSISSLYIYLPTFFAFVPLVMLPVSIQLLLMEGATRLSLGSVGIIFIFVMSLFNINQNRNLKESLRLRFENISLIKQLKEQKDEADKANRDKSKFLAAASHDLRQPLYALSLFTSVLEEQVEPPKIKSVVNKIKTSCNSLKDLFNALLNVSQLDAGAIKPKKQSFLLQPLFDILANDFDPLAEQKGLSIQWPKTDLAVSSDKDLLEQIFRNLASNAIKYTDQGHISISCSSEEQQIEICFSDTGIGISASDREAIFGEYNQVANPERDRDKGLGLGLFIAQRAASLLTHTITVKSVLHKGSTFSIRVPQAKIKKNTIKPALLSEINENEFYGLTIVIIDDDVSVMEGTKELFENWGCNTVAATGLEQALNILSLEDIAPDGIITDYRLSDNKNGVDAIQTIQAKFKKKMTSLIVTGDIEVDRLKKIDKTGIQMLPKPVNALKLKTFLRNVKKQSITNNK